MIRKYLPAASAWAIILLLYYLSRDPQLSDTDLQQLANRYDFTGHKLPVISRRMPQQIREVHPSLQHLAAWISFVGAAATVGDLDNDGLPNDLIHVDPRYDEIVVLPVPGTADRYDPFILSAPELMYETRSTAPMGTLIGDFDEDGRPDILAYFWGRTPILFLQKEGVTTDPRRLGIAAFACRELVEPPQVWHTSCALQADVDGDGHVDLVVGNYNPDGARTLDPTDTSRREVMMGSWGRARNGGISRILLWSSKSGTDGQFVEQPSAIPPEIARGWAFALGACDLDGDMLPELYFVHDFGPDALLHNRSHASELELCPLVGRWTPHTPRSQRVGKDSFNGMGIDYCDINGDGRFDFIVSNITSDYGLHQSNLLFVQVDASAKMKQGVAPYRCEAERYGVSRGGWTWDTKFADFDNDGTEEIMQTTGFMRGKVNRWPELHEMALGNEEIAKYPAFYPRLGSDDDVAGSEHNPFFVKNGDRYYDIGPKLHAMFHQPALSRALAIADVDGDGDLDFALANHWEDSHFFTNQSRSANQFIGLHLRLARDHRQQSATIVLGHPNGTVPSMPAFGASVEVTIRTVLGTRVCVAQVDGGNGHSGHRAPDVHFGLGELPEDAVISAVVKWRSLDGEVHTHALAQLTPGWHTVYLNRK